MLDSGCSEAPLPEIGVMHPCFVRHACNALDMFYRYIENRVTRASVTFEDLRWSTLDL